MDQFTLKKIRMTPELGTWLKDFRKKHKITAKEIANSMEPKKTPGWISKMEKGIFQRIKTEELISICNLITDSDHGMTDFVEKLPYEKVGSFSKETKVSLDNIEDLVIEYSLPEPLISEIINYMNENGITSDALAEQIQKNSDIQHLPGYEKMPINEWTDMGIRLQIPEDYILSLLNHNVQTIHSVIIEGILNSMYILGGEESHRSLAQDKLEQYSIERKRYKVYKEKLDAIQQKIDNVDPEVQSGINDLSDTIKLISALSNDGGKTAIRQISDNLHMDQGFFYTFMRTDLTSMKNKTHQQKKAFLQDVRNLVEKYSNSEDSGIEMYD